MNKHLKERRKQNLKIKFIIKNNSLKGRLMKKL